VGRERGKAYISQQRETDIDQQVSAAAGDEEDADGGELSRQHYALLKNKAHTSPGGRTRMVMRMRRKAEQKPIFDVIVSVLWVSSWFGLMRRGSSEVCKKYLRCG
jgi:hypothetical protein